MTVTNDIFFLRCDPTRVMVSSFLRFLNYIQRRTTVGRTPLDEWSARRRDLYLTTHNTHNRQTSMPSVGFELTISAGERPLGLATCHIYSDESSPSPKKISEISLQYHFTHSAEHTFLTKSKIIISFLNRRQQYEPDCNVPTLSVFVSMAFIQCGSLDSGTSLALSECN